MATVVGITGMQLNEEELRRLTAGVTRGIARACDFGEDKVSMMILPPLPEECHGPTVVDRITYFVYTHEGKSLKMKAELVYKVITFIQEHKFRNCGLDRAVDERD